MITSGVVTMVFWNEAEQQKDPKGAGEVHLRSYTVTAANMRVKDTVTGNVLGATEVASGDNTKTIESTVRYSTGFGSGQVPGLLREDPLKPFASSLTLSPGEKFWFGSGTHRSMENGTGGAVENAPDGSAEKNADGAPADTGPSGRRGEAIEGEAISLYGQYAQGTLLPSGEIEYPDWELNPRMDMPETDMYGYRYIAVLELPSLGLELPVMSRWDYHRLRIAPCRYEGSAYTDDLVIAAHNYQSHFGRLSSLRLGDAVELTDMDGNVFRYRVAEVTTLQPGAVEEIRVHGDDRTREHGCAGGDDRAGKYARADGDDRARKHVRADGDDRARKHVRADGDDRTREHGRACGDDRAGKHIRTVRHIHAGEHGRAHGFARSRKHICAREYVRTCGDDCAGKHVRADGDARTREHVRA